MLFNDDTDETELDLSPLGIFVLTMHGLELLRSVRRLEERQVVHVRLQSGKAFLGLPDQRVVTGDNLELVLLKDLEEEQLLQFCGQFHLHPNQSYINLINELLERSSLDHTLDLGHIKVLGVHDYLESLSQQGRSQQPRSMNLLAFSSLLDENGVYESELEYLQLSSGLSPYPMDSKLHLSEDLFEFLGYFWRYGHYHGNLIHLQLPDMLLASRILELSRHVFGAHSTIFPNKGGYAMNVGTEIHALILRDIFKLRGDHSHLPDRIFSMGRDFVTSFLKAIIDGEESSISSSHSMGTQSLLLLLSSMSMYPRVITQDGTDTILLSGDEFRAIMSDDKHHLQHNEGKELDRVVEVKTIDLEQPIYSYQLNCRHPYLADGGLYFGS